MTEIAKQRIVFLVSKFLKQELSDNERTELNTWIAESQTNRKIFEKLTDTEDLAQMLREEYKFKPVETTKQKLDYLIQSGGGKAKIWSLWLRLSVAAAILIVLALSGILILHNKHEAGTGLAKTETPKPDIAPGTNKATLILADGRSIVLDRAKTGQLAQQGGTEVLNKNGQLVYTAGGKKVEVLWNNLSTSKGQTYPLLLADGSRVTLNSESSISYPVAFTGDFREVKLITGEVFFEVAHNAGKPFRVSTGGIVIEDLGTTFNVSAYQDEDVKATLVEGSVQVKKGVQKKIIKPGQQAQVLPADIKVTNVDVDKVTAWKQGFFRFKEDKLSEAMKNIARWYNIDVVFEGDAQNIEISGDINRSSNLSEVLKILSLLKVEGRIESRKLILKSQ